MFATHRPSSLPQLSEFGSAMNGRTRSWVYIFLSREVLVYR